MDPYLEPHWLDVHASLAIGSRDSLNEQLPDDRPPAGYSSRTLLFRIVALRGLLSRHLRRREHVALAYAAPSPRPRDASPVDAALPRRAAGAGRAGA
jgi:hypothetical protein